MVILLIYQCNFQAKIKNKCGLIIFYVDQITLTTNALIFIRNHQILIIFTPCIELLFHFHS